MEVDISICRSPKRKRDPAPTPRVPRPSLVTSGLSHCLPSSTTDQPDDTTSIGSHSPSTRVTGKFQKLELRSPVDLPSPVGGYDFDTPRELALNDNSHQSPPSTQEPSPPDSQDFKPPATDFNFESPLTHAPVSAASIDPNSNSNSTTTTTTLTNTNTKPPTKSPKSPPPSLPPNSIWWSASEITGWTPNDPDEDYYGVNGVGYAKPPARAYAISQKRKQQIAEYRSRETREARQRRHERRRSGVGGIGGGSGSARGSRRGSLADGGGEGRDDGSGRKGVRFVHFEDG